MVRQTSKQLQGRETVIALQSEDMNKIISGTFHYLKLQINCDRLNKLEGKQKRENTLRAQHRVQTDPSLLLAFSLKQKRQTSTLPLLLYYLSL